MNTRLEDISDYPSLKKLATVLWRQDNSYHGAAIMIGAGFSRCAATTGDSEKRLPLWNDLSNAIMGEMGRDGNSDPLRLAEEYAAYFGKQSLYDLVKNKVPDLAFSPGELYKNLLTLPWSEVLTTNWDTLLERASTDIHHPIYNIVAKQEDLASARSPRIVKLHGTVNITEDLIFTQEDYRKYPIRHAAFVNFARQVFIENEFCLLGFSGDDPNFLQWTGWVRDHLATNARKIYLVGVLNLTAAKRKYLESINVAPIDLSDTVKIYEDPNIKHFYAAKIFLEALENLRPPQLSEWTLKQDFEQNSKFHDSKKTDIAVQMQIHRDRLPFLSSDRLAYPGWIVCPPNYQWDLQNQIYNPFISKKILTEMDMVSKAKILYEVAWRHSISYAAISSWMAKEILLVCNSEQANELSKKHRLELCVILLKNSKWIDVCDASNIRNSALEVLSAGEIHWADAAQETLYHKLKVARDDFDYQTLEDFVDKMSTKNSSDKLKKAAILAELGRLNDGAILVKDAYQELRSQFRNSPNSIFILSRLAWAQWMLRGVNRARFIDERPDYNDAYEVFKCNPWAHIENIEERLDKLLTRQKKKQGIEAMFEPGRYRDNSSTITYTSEIHPFLLLEGITDSVGIPIRWGSVNFLVDIAAKICELNDVDELHRFSLAVRASNDDSSEVLNNVFSRNKIACIPISNVNILLMSYENAIKYWVERLSNRDDDLRMHALGRVRVFLEVLARITVRATSNQAKSIFVYACTLSQRKEFRHFWLGESLKHLIDY